MKLELSKTNQAMLAGALAIAAAFAFWVLALSPKRDEAKELSSQIERTEASLSAHQAEISQGLAARKKFPVDYQQLVVLGKAVPEGDDTPSLLVQLSRIAKRSHVDFGTFDLSSEGGGGGEAPPAPEASSSGEPAPPTEVAASLLPLGATIGPAGLPVMPYDLTFTGSFFHLADFIHGLDSLVETRNSNVAVTGRLITIDGFSLSASQDEFPKLSADFEVTTYLTPPSGVTGGATPAGPAPETATPAATTTGGTP